MKLSWRRSMTKAGSRRVAVRAKPFIEFLEDRTVPAIVTVTPADLDGWQVRTSGTAMAQFEHGPATPPLGTGSVELRVGADGNSAAQLRNVNFSGVRLADLTALSYSTYVDVPGSGGQAPYIILHADRDGNLTTTTDRDLLFFEPVYQSGHTPAVPDQGPIVLDTWQTWNARVGGWYGIDAATFTPTFAGPGADVRPLANYSSANPNAVVFNPGSNGGVRIVTGFGAGAWDNFVGNIDNMTIDTTTIEEITYNFEPAVRHGIGTFDPADGTFRLRTTATSGPADFQFRFGGENWVGLAGDWNGDGTDTIGSFDPSTATFYLRNQNNNDGPPDVIFQFGGSSWIPLMGDWDGNSTDTVGAFDPSTATFYLRNANNNNGPPDFVFSFGGSEHIPLAGDWDGIGGDGIGAFDGATATFRLRNTLGAGPSDITFQFGGGSWHPVMGDWDGDGDDTVGSFDPSNARFFLRNQNDNNGPPDAGVFTFNNVRTRPLAGDWNGPAALRAAGGTSLRVTDGVSISPADIDSLASFAVSMFRAAGWETAPLQNVSFAVADLPGNLLGQTQGNTITLDHDAAGYGWFIDPTPATRDDLDPGAMDLLTALAHELGHVLGLGHAEQSGFMSEYVARGERQLPVRARDAVFTGS
jgi:hypothetical protein